LCIKLYFTNTSFIAFVSVISNLFGGSDLVNFDTTTLIVFVSVISNGVTEKFLAILEMSRDSNLRET